MSDTQIVLARRESPRKLAYAAAAGLAVGVVGGFLLARQIAPTPAATVAAGAPAGAAAPVRATHAAPVAVPVAATAPGPAASPPPAAAVAERNPSAEPAAAATATTPPAARDPVAARLAAGREWLAQPQQARYSVQLMVTDAKERAYLEQYLGEAARALPREQLYLVPTGNPDSPRVGLLYGGFRERGEANAALGALPETLRQFRPYVRTLEALRDEARRAQARPAA